MRPAVASLTPLSFGPLRRILAEDDDQNDPQAGHMIRETVVSSGYTDAVGATLEDARREGLRFIPQSLAEALDEFEADEVVQGALGPELAAEFIRVKRSEWVRYHNTVGRWEVDQYLTLF